MNTSQLEHSNHLQLIFYSNRSLLPHLLHFPSPLPLQLFGTNSLLTLNLQLVSAPLNLVSKLNSAPPTTVQRSANIVQLIHISCVTIALC